MLLLSISMTLSGSGIVLPAAQLDDAAVVAIDAEFRGAGQHAVALDARTIFLPERHIDRA